MLTYTLRRLAYLVPTLFGITLVTFLIISLAPGNPADVVRGSANISAEAYDEMLRLYGLDKPIPVRYAIWVKRLVTLDFGNSFLDHRPVMTKIAERLPATLVLNAAALFFTLIFAVPFGLHAAIRQHSRFDKIGGTFLYMLYSLPEFWVALMLIMLFGVKLGMLPFIGIESLGASEMGFWPRLWDRIMHMILPTICLTYGSLAFLSRFVRGSTLEVINKDYIRTARAKGLDNSRIVYKHIFKNTLIPVVTLLGILLPALISGSIILETIFSWPGAGALFFDAVLSRDYPTVMGLSFITALMVLFSTLIADLLYTWVDPRVSYDQRS
jgi:peptide/nickel transport system permease protein